MFSVFFKKNCFLLLIYFCFILTMYFFLFVCFYFSCRDVFWFLCLIVFFFVCFRFLLQQTFSAEAGVIMLTCLDPCA